MQDRIHIDVELLTPEELEYFEERAAIREFDGIMPRKEAERLALLDLAEERRLVLW